MMRQMVHGVAVWRGTSYADSGKKTHDVKRLDLCSPTVVVLGARAPFIQLKQIGAMRRAPSFTNQSERSMSMNYTAKNRVPRARWERTLVCIVSLSAALLATRAIEARRLVSATEARQLGLERSWLTQVSLDSARNRLERAVLNGDRLTVLTTAGVVQELDALTGQTIWSVRI